MTGIVCFMLCICVILISREVIRVQKTIDNNDLVLVDDFTKIQITLLDIQKQIDALDKMVIKKNDYNAQSCITIKPDGSQYIPIVITDEPMKQELLKKGELQAWDKRSVYLDLSTLYKKIERDTNGKIINR